MSAFRALNLAPIRTDRVQADTGIALRALRFECRHVCTVIKEDRPGKRYWRQARISLDVQVGDNVQNNVDLSQLPRQVKCGVVEHR
jgi:hypothetical protein